LLSAGNREFRREREKEKFAGWEEGGKEKGTRERGGGGGGGGGGEERERTRKRRKSAGEAERNRKRVEGKR